LIVFWLFLLAVFAFFFRIFDEHARAERAKGGDSTESAPTQKAR